MKLKLGTRMDFQSMGNYTQFTGPGLNVFKVDLVSVTFSKISQWVFGHYKFKI